MKKKFILFIISLLIPIGVNAMELNCPKGPYVKDNMFECTLSDNAGYNYQELKASIISGDGINCYVKNVSDGIINTSNMNNTISITGKSNTSNILTIECGVTSENNETFNTIVTLDDFIYTLDSGISEDNLIIKSDYIEIRAYSNIEIDTKPRDTSNPATLLNNISIDGIDFTFSKYILIYDIQVPYDLTNIDINYVLDTDSSSVNIVKPDVLAIGKNVIDVYITTADGSSTTCYTFNITRLNLGEEPYYQEQDATLEFLLVNDKNLNFQFDKYLYEYKIENDATKVDINAEPKIKNAEVNIVGNDNLQNGSIISIYVKSVDGTITKEYKINIIKDVKNNNLITYLIIGGGIILLIGIIVLIILIMRQKKKEKPIEEIVPMDEKTLDETKKRILNRVATPIPAPKEEVEASKNIGNNQVVSEPEKLLNTNPNTQIKTIVINTKPINQVNTESKHSAPNETNIEPININNEANTPIINNLELVDEEVNENNILGNQDLLSSNNLETNKKIENELQNEINQEIIPDKNQVDNILPITPTTPRLPQDQIKNEE